MFSFSEFHLCSTGDASPNFGTRGGDSGTLVFLEENGRYWTLWSWIFIYSTLLCLYYFFDPQNCYRYTGVGINSFNSDPDVFAKVTPAVKEWIQSIASKTQDSNCIQGSTTTSSPTTSTSGYPTLNKTIELVGGSNRKEGNILLYGKPIW